MDNRISCPPEQAHSNGKPGESHVGIMPTSPVVTTEREAWHMHADQLVAWTLQHLVNRTDVYGRYTDSKSGQFTAKDGLTAQVLMRHFWATTRNDVIGLHTTAAEEIDGVVKSTCRWSTNDIDQHDPKVAGST